MKYLCDEIILIPWFTVFLTHVVLMAHMEDIKVGCQKETKKMRETLMVKIKSDFDWWRLGVDVI